MELRRQARNDTMHPMKALLKLSGQVLKGGTNEIISRDYLWRLAAVIKRAQADGHQLAIVVGGGNIYRFVANRRDPRDEQLNPMLAHGRGLLSILLNGLWLTDVFQAAGIATATFSPAFADSRFVQADDPQDSQAAFDGGAVVIFGGGTGEPGVSTDVAAVILAKRLGLDLILKATHTVDGVYTADPVKDPAAVKLDQLTFSQALSDGLAIMDERALREANENGQRIQVFSLRDPTTLTKVLAGETIGSTITTGGAHDLT